MNSSTGVHCVLINVFLDHTLEGQLTVVALKQLVPLMASSVGKWLRPKMGTPKVLRARVTINTHMMFIRTPVATCTRFTKDKKTQC